MVTRKHYRIHRRPRTPGDALAVIQAWYDIGMEFSASDPDMIAKLNDNDALVMVRETEEADG